TRSVLCGPATNGACDPDLHDAGLTCLKPAPGACHVVVMSGVPATSCLEPGTGKLGEPCQAPRDWPAGFGCVHGSAPNAGICLPYCCDGPGSCSPSTY